MCYSVSSSCSACSRRDVGASEGVALSQHGCGPEGQVVFLAFLTRYPKQSHQSAFPILLFHQPTMMPDAWLWICAVFVVIFLLFIMVYHVR